MIKIYKNTSLKKTIATAMCIFSLSCLAYLAPLVDASSAIQQNGLSIAEEMKRREKGYGNYTADMKMVLISTNGKETIRELYIKAREIENDGDQSIAIFEAPADVKGTVFLIHSHIGRNEDQWLYLPAIARVKRISSQNKTAPFMGSEFSYEDLGSTEIENYTYQYVADEDLNGQACFVLDRFPVNELSGYNKERVWIEKDRYLALKIEYYNRKDEKLKTLISSDFNHYLGKFWRAHKMLMQNHISGKSTVLYWNNFKFQQDLIDSDFSPNSLKRQR